MKINIHLILFIIILTGCSRNGGELFSNPKPKDTGITFSNILKESDDLNILDYLYFYNGGGVALGDINNDGLPDIYLSGNQVKNKLYLNKGNLTFEDITASAGVEGSSSWNTGAVMGDVNGDGLLDIYVCAVVGLNGFEGHNELFINNGDTTFTEQSAQYGLNLDTYSSSAAFLDFDLDGDLDIYLLNHAVHTQESYGHADLRFRRNYETGDRLLRNDGSKFVDVSESSGIFGGLNGYGLGVAVSDYVGNDFHEDDYYYLNNGDGTFAERLKDYFGHTSRFSMGNDVADINHDGLPDILSLDMLPEDEVPLKSSEGDENIQTLNLRTRRFGYHYQFIRNMLHINQPNGQFMETGLYSGIAATDWSWSALFADYNQDGEQDLFVSNGIPRRPTNLDFIKFTSNEQIRKKINNTKLVDQQALDMMPSGAVQNYIFEGSDNLQFKDRSAEWIANERLISGATAMGDLDNDGDLDIITNNINAPATLYLNKTNEKSNYLKLKFSYTKGNPFGIGTKVYSYHQGKLQFKELYTVRGFQASSEPLLHFGYGTTSLVDSLKVVWPDNTVQILQDVSVNQSLQLKPENTKRYTYPSKKPLKKLFFEKVSTNLGVSFTHEEDRFIDFNRQKLIPYQISDRGPATAIGDLNNDGKDDIFFGGSNRNPSKIFVQQDSLFAELKIPSIANDSIKEDVSANIADFNGDGIADLFVGVGGGNYGGTSKQISDNLYVNTSGSFQPKALPPYFQNTAVSLPYDMDADGDIDLFIGSNGVSSDFGKIPNSYVLKNENGEFNIEENPELINAGMITDGLWTDFDQDGIKDLIVVGEWMSPKFFKNTNGVLEEQTLLTQNINGLWQSIAPFDIDHDGDLDYVLGNWGSNSKFKATSENPLKMYYGDFDANGVTETVLAQEKNGTYYPINNLDELSEQMISLRKKFTNYKDFAGKSITEIWDKATLSKTTVHEVTTLESGYLQNNNGKFKFVPFSRALQMAPITSLLTYDFDGNGTTEVLAAGNYFGVQPYHGRFDTFSGAIIKAENDVILGPETGLEIYQKSVRHLDVFHLNKQPYLLVTINNDAAQVYKLIRQ